MNNTNIKPYGQFQLWVLNNFPFTIDDFDSITQYQMLLKCLGSIKEQIDINSDLYKKIQDLENYLANLDLQEYVDNKIDEMVESGELQEIITEYLQINGLLVYNTLSDLKTAQNLIEGSKVKTLGYYSINDGGSATYFVRKVTNQDVVNDGNIVALNDETLVAVLVPNIDINFIQFGAKSNNEDDSTAVKNCLDYANDNSLNIDLLNKTYNVSDHIEIDNIEVKNGKIIIENNKNVTLKNKVRLYNVELNSTINEGLVKLEDTQNLVIENCTIKGGIICRTHATNTKILNTKFIGHGYHILFDDMFYREYTDTIGHTFICDNCEFIIDNNNFWGDLIEINTPNYSFNNVFVSNCYAHLDDSVNNPTQSTVPAIGFGFAKVNNIIIDNNILDSVSSGNGVLHFEDSEDIVVTNNQIINNKDVQYSKTFNALEIVKTKKCNISNNIITDYPIGIIMLNDNETCEDFIIDSNYFKCYRYGIYGNKLTDFTISNNRFNMAVKNSTITDELQGISVYEYNEVVGIQNSNICNNYFYLPTNQLENTHYTYAMNIGSSTNIVVNSNYSRGVGKSNPAGTFAGSGYKTATGNNGVANMVISDNTPVGYLDGNSKSVVVDTNNHRLYKYANGSWVAGCVIYDEDMTDFEQSSVTTLALKCVKKNGVKSILNTAGLGTNLTSGTEYTIMTISDPKARPTYTVYHVVNTPSNKSLFIKVTTAGVISIKPLQDIPSGSDVTFNITYV